MKLKDITAYLESEIPLSFQEDYDNSGLQVGQPDMEVASALLTLDVTEEVMNEAIDRKCDMIISHHPLIFHGLKKITGSTSAGRIIYKAILNNIAICSLHTNLDIIGNGVSRKMAGKLGLENVRVLSPLKGKLLKLVTFVPESHLDRVRDAIFEAGAGISGNYDRCGFAAPGTGSFRGNDNANPFVGIKGSEHFEKEIRFETILLSHLKEKVIAALLKAHPYEEVAYDILALENRYGEAGLGCIGELGEETGEMDFLEKLAEVFHADGIRYSGLTGKKIRRVALCGGSGASLTGEALAAGADVFVTADIKYHSFADAEGRILLVDIGHFESEKFSAEIIHDLIIKKFPTFAVRFAKTNTNPINYL